MNKELIKTEDWYQGLIEDCQALMVEGIWNYRLTLIKTYHLLGKRILEENDNFKRSDIYGERLCHTVSQSLGQSKRTIWRAIQFAKKYPKLDKLLEGKNISWNKICNLYLPEPKKEKIELPEGKYSVLLADPPWTYKNTGVEGAVDKEYPTMTIEELSGMLIKDLTTENAVLFLWITNPILEEGFEVIKNWGFSYKTNMVYVKKGGKPGIGFYVRGCHELLLICIKGSFLPLSKEYVSSVIEANRLPHSQKPEIVYEIIEKLYPNQKYLELFARNNKKRKGWKYWGDQANT